MPNPKDSETTTVGMHLSEEKAARIKRQANEEHRSVSSLLKSIVLPEIDRREKERGKAQPV